jgi:hypothetical protein
VELAQAVLVELAQRQAYQAHQQHTLQVARVVQVRAQPLELRELQVPETVELVPQDLVAELLLVAVTADQVLSLSPT